MRPCSITMMRSQDNTVARRCAITSVVRWRISSSSAVCTNVSLSASSDEVASSSSKSRASRRMARAIAMRWRWPQRNAALAQLRLKTAGQAADEFGGVRQIGGALDFRIAGIGPPEADVFARGGGERHGILRHQCDPRADLARVGVADRHAVKRDGAIRRIVKPQQQVKQRALART